METKPEKTFLYRFVRSIVIGLSHTIFPVHVYGKEKLNGDAPYILISNHKSLMDPLFLCSACKRHEIRFLGKIEITKNGLIKKLTERLHMIPVKRHETDMAAMRQCMKTLREGHVLGIFPEGTRKLPSLMETVEPGAAILALRAQVPILPAYIDRKIHCFHRTNIYIGNVMDLHDLAGQYDADTVEQVTKRIQKLFWNMRDEVQN